MTRRKPSVLVGTDIMVQCHRAGSWKALSGGYRLETVAQCVAKASLERRRRREQHRIDRARLIASLNAVHEVGERELALLALQTCGVFLTADEAALWAHALGRDDEWILCGSDAANRLCAERLGVRERLASLERLLDDVGRRSREQLRTHDTERWRRKVLNGIVTYGMRNPDPAV